MCGFTILFGLDPSKTPLSYYYANIGRGGDSTKVVYLPSIDATVIFHRLSIIGTGGSLGEQPIHKHGKLLVCNGEIYNYKSLREQVASKDNIYDPVGTSDCEVLLDLYHHHNSLEFLDSVDGVFAFVILDIPNQRVCFGRDSYGVRPAYISPCGKAISSTLRGIPPEFRENCSQIPSGTYGMYQIGDAPTSSFTKWTKASMCSTDVFPASFPNAYIDALCKKVGNVFIDAVQKRVIHTERDIGCLLSGGLDSSIVAAIVVRTHCLRGGSATDIHTFTIGISGSPDIEYARTVSEYLGTTHHEWVYTKDMFLKAIPDVIRDTASYDVTTIRASVGNWLVAKHISEATSVRVVFNGDGADEVCGGYAYMHLSPSLTDFDTECKHLIDNIYLYDGLRSDRCITAHGLEARTPFLDKEFVRTYLSIPACVRAPGTVQHTKCWSRVSPTYRKMTKWFFRYAFMDMNLLPDEILWRHKEAFSDGVSSQSQTWGDITKQYAHTLVPLHLRDTVTPEDAEKSLYKSLFQEFYGNCEMNILPEYWMPKWTGSGVTDPSARVLGCYEDACRPVRTPHLGLFPSRGTGGSR